MCFPFWAVVFLERLGVYSWGGRDRGAVLFGIATGVVQETGAIAF